MLLYGNKNTLIIFLRLSIIYKVQLYMNLAGNTVDYNLYDANIYSRREK